MADQESPIQTKESESSANPVPMDPPPPYQASYGDMDAAPPPAYGTNDAPPPSYDSIFGEMQRAKAESNGVVEFFKKVFIILISTLGCTVCVGLVLAVPISMIVMGSLYLYECPRERYIPIYLIVAGTFGVIKNLSNMIQRCKNRHEESDEDNARTNPVDSTLSCFLLVWFIAGNVWIYRIYNDYSPDPEAGSYYCDATLYTFAFWMTTSTYILMGTACCCMVCVGVTAALCGIGGNSSATSMA